MSYRAGNTNMARASRQRRDRMNDIAEAKVRAEWAADGEAAGVRRSPSYAVW
jgi:hypothetical protein